MKPGSRIERLKKDAEYLRSHEVHKLFNSIATELLADRPEDVLTYLKRWAIDQIELRDCPAYSDVEAGDYPPSATQSDCARSDQPSSRRSESVRSHPTSNGLPPRPPSATRPMSRQSSINMLRRAYPSTDPPEKVQYPPSGSDAEGLAETTSASRAARRAGRLETTLTAAKNDWRPSPVELRERFPSPTRRFEVGELVSSGHYGSVYRGRKVATGELFAIKKVAIDGHWVISEYENLLHCACAHVVGCEGCYYNEEEDMLWFVMEFLGYTLECDLPDGRYLKEEFIAGLIQQILVALREIHARCRVHLDVKPANLLYGETGSIKLGDFGTMATIGEPCIQLGDFCFMAPEVAYSQGYFTDRSDIWSVGAVAITMADGGPPLCREDPKLLMYIHHETCMVPSLWEPHKWSVEFRDFLSKCFTKDTMFRPSAIELLQHPWIVHYATDPRSFGANKFQDVPRGIRTDADSRSHGGSTGNSEGV